MHSAALGTGSLQEFNTLYRLPAYAKKKNRNEIYKTSPPFVFLTLDTFVLGCWYHAFLSEDYTGPI